MKCLIKKKKKGIKLGSQFLIVKSTVLEWGIKRKTKLCEIWTKGLYLMEEKKQQNTCKF